MDFYGHLLIEDTVFGTWKARWKLGNFFFAWHTRRVSSFWPCKTAEDIRVRSSMKYSLPIGSVAFANYWEELQPQQLWRRSSLHLQRLTRAGS